MFKSKKIKLTKHKKKEFVNIYSMHNHIPKGGEQSERPFAKSAIELPLINEKT